MPASQLSAVLSMVRLACTQASRWPPGETPDRAAKLIGFGLILGVIDDREGAARQRQRYVERFGLGARTDRRGNMISKAVRD